MSERFFIQSGMVRRVPEGAPEAYGIDTRSVVEVGRAPRPGERWVGFTRGMVLTAAAGARIAADGEREAREARWRATSRIELAAAAERLEARVAALEARLAMLEQRP